MIQARPYDTKDADRWDYLCSGAYMATFLHTRRFLAYHGDRFTDASTILEQDGEWMGLFPAAVDPADQGIVISHPGATYGGIIHSGDLRGESMLQAMQALLTYYGAAGFRALYYKAIPFVYHQAPAQDDLYALFRIKARRYRCDLTTAIDLTCRLPVSKRRSRSLKRAKSSGVTVVEGVEHAPSLWDVLNENLSQKHGAKPVHSLEEILLLQGLFPGHIVFVCALLDGQLVAGVVLFLSAKAAHAQYIASNRKGHEVSALDAVFEFAIEMVKGRGMRFFDFGISNESAGWELNQSLFRFKAEFGAGAAVHEFYQVDLSGSNDLQHGRS